MGGVRHDSGSPEEAPTEVTCDSEWSGARSAIAQGGALAGVSGGDVAETWASTRQFL